MEFSNRIENGICIISVKGEIAIDGVRLTRDYIMTHIEDEAVKGLIINLENVRFIDSNGMGLIITVSTAMQERNGSFAITNLSKSSEDNFTASHLNTILNIYSTESEALSSFGG